MLDLDCVEAFYVICKDEALNLLRSIENRVSFVVLCNEKEDDVIIPHTS